MYKTKILVHRQIALGDVIMTTPIIRAIHNQYQGNCEIDVSTQYAEVFKNNPYVNQVITPEQINIANYDHFINLNLAYEKNLKTHVVEAYKRLAVGHAVDIDDLSTEINFGDDDSQTADDFITANNIKDDNFIVVHIHQGGWPAKNLPIDFWSDMIENILDNTDTTVVQVGMPNEMAFDGDDRLVNALGKFNIPQLAALISKSKLYVGVDSGPTHVAGTTKTPIACFYTAARAEYLKPLRKEGSFTAFEADIECYGCRENILPPKIDFVCQRGDVDCVNRFDIDAVNETILGLIK